MIGNDIIQQALVSKANSTPNIQSSLPSGTILEANVQTTDFTYPCARIQVESQIDIGEMNTHCPSQVDWSFYIYSEKASSRECNQIATKFTDSFRGISFGLHGVKFSRIRILENIPAIREDERTWRAQVRCQSVVHNA